MGPCCKQFLTILDRLDIFETKRKVLRFLFDLLKNNYFFLWENHTYRQYVMIMYVPIVFWPIPSIHLSSNFIHIFFFNSRCILLLLPIWAWVWGHPLVELPTTSKKNYILPATCHLLPIVSLQGLRLPEPILSHAGISTGLIS